MFWVKLCTTLRANLKPSFCQQGMSSLSALSPPHPAADTGSWAPLILQ